MSRLRWGDAEDDDDVIALPESTTVGPNDKGIITKIEYYRNNKGDPMKQVTKIQLCKVQTKVFEVTAARKKWAKFGISAQAGGNKGVTSQSNDQIPFERTNIVKKEEKKDAAALAKQAMGKFSLQEVMEEKRRQREMERIKKLQVDGPEATPQRPESAAAQRTGDVYVPPSRKLGAGGVDRPRDADYSLRVSNLSETVSETDLRVLFGTFGDISRACVVYDRETHEHRGFAFVNFRRKEHAEKAMSILDGYGYENMILRVEMAAPRER